MGCGSSSLKGDAPKGLSGGSNNDSSALDDRPIRKIATNFTTVDYEQAPADQRTAEYAPHETVRAASATSEAIRHAKRGISPRVAAAAGVSDEDDEDEGGGGSSSDPTLKPYQSIDAAVADDEHTISAAAKDELASATGHEATTTTTE